MPKWLELGAENMTKCSLNKYITNPKILNIINGLKVEVVKWGISYYTMYNIHLVYTVKITMSVHYTRYSA